MEANRFEILVDAAPLKPGPADGDFLASGDVRIKAQNRIILEAGQEIQIIVERSSVVISDRGVEIRSRQTTGINGPGDAIITACPVAGVGILGQDIKIIEAAGIFVDRSLRRQREQTG